MNNYLTNIQNIAIVSNNKAGRGKTLAIVEYLIKKLQQVNISYSVFNDRLPDSFGQFSSLWLVGGDGTLNFFINKYPDITIPIALFKGGTGNDFAWKLYGNKSVEEYLDIVLYGTPKQVDAGICNGKYFINGVGIGFDGDVVKAMGAHKFLPGHLAYLLIVLKKILFYREKRMIVETDKIIWNGKLFMLTVANGSRYGGGFLVAPTAKIDDEILDIIVIKRIFPLLRFFHLPKVEKGKHLHLRFVETHTAKKVVVKSEEKLSGHLDGEVMEANQFNIEILPAKFLFFY